MYVSGFTFITTTSEFRDNLLLKMYKLYGVNHPLSIQFEDMCNSYPNNDIWDSCLEHFVNAHIENPYKN